MIKQEDLTGQILVEKVEMLMSHPDKLQKMSQNAKEMAVVDATDRIIHALEEIV